jgi:hypothetical protein
MIEGIAKNGDELGMLRDFHRMKWGDRVPLAALLALVLLVPGCGGGGFFGGPAATPTPDVSAPPPPSSPSLANKFTSFFAGASQRDPQPVTNAQANVDCPLIDIRQGASTLTIPPPPPDGANEAMSLKYQGIFVRAARECAAVGGQLVMKIGVEGRIVVGPAGGPGEVEVPLRIAVVSGPTAGSKTIATKLIRIPVTVGNDDNATFTHIEEGFSFPLPSPAVLDSYIVYIGFDPIGAAQEDKQKLKPAPASKPKARPKPTAPTG